MSNFYPPSEYTGRKWAVQIAGHPNAVPKVYPFLATVDREQWVARNPLQRQAVGKRHPWVKAFRQENDAKWRASLRKNREGKPWRVCPKGCGCTPVASYGSWVCAFWWKEGKDA